MKNTNKELADKIISLLEKKDIILTKEIKNNISEKIEDFAKEITIKTSSESECNCKEETCFFCGTLF